MTNPPFRYGVRSELDQEEWQLVQLRIDAFWREGNQSLLARYPDAKIRGMTARGSFTITVTWPNDGAAPFLIPLCEDCYDERNFLGDNPVTASDFVTRAIHHIEGIRSRRVNPNGRIQYVFSSEYGYA